MSTPIPAPPAPASDGARVLRMGVFDSGVGGLTVLRALGRALPQVQWVYVADTAHGPYGERTEDEVRVRSVRITEYLLAEAGCAGVVVACNTATAVAVAQLRARWPGVTVVGVEPGVKPAVAQSRTQRIGVMATPATLRQPRFAALVQAHAAHATVVALPCPGLAWAIEQGDWQAPPLLALLDQFCGALRAQHLDTVVLGCTHYAFVCEQIAQRLGPAVVLIDTAEAVARHTAACLAGAFTLARPAVPLECWSSGPSPALQHLARQYLGLEVRVQALPV